MRRAAFFVVLFSLGGCAVFDAPPAMPTRADMEALSCGPLADAIAAAKPGVPR